MALIFPVTTDPLELVAIRLIRSIESVVPILAGAPDYPWFNRLMDEAMRVGFDRRVTRCALRLIMQYLPITDRALQWTLFVFHNCIVPSSWALRVRAVYIHLEPATRSLYNYATGTPPPSVDQLATFTRSTFNRWLSLPPPTPSLTLIDLNPIRAGYVALRDYVQLR